LLSQKIISHARVEIRDERNFPVKGFTRDACDLIRGNHVHHVVTWRGNPDPSSMTGKPVRLHFAMRNVKLYAFAFIA